MVSEKDVCGVFAAHNDTVLSFCTDLVVYRSTLIHITWERLMLNEKSEFRYLIFLSFSFFSLIYDKSLIARHKRDKFQH